MNAFLKPISDLLAAVAASIAAVVPPLPEIAAEIASCQSLLATADAEFSADTKKQITFAVASAVNNAQAAFNASLPDKIAAAAAAQKIADDAAAEQKIADGVAAAAAVAAVAAAATAEAPFKPFDRNNP